MAAKKKALNLKEILKPVIGKEVTLKALVDTIDEDEECDYVRLLLSKDNDLKYGDDDEVYGDYCGESIWISKPLYEHLIREQTPELKKVMLQEKIAAKTQEIADLKKELSGL